MAWRVKGEKILQILPLDAVSPRPMKDELEINIGKLQSFADFILNNDRRITDQIQRGEFIIMAKALATCKIVYARMGRSLKPSGNISSP
ncbi:hypothetical protein GOZ89_15305 [Agrobacterium vitis]|uniref:hypothetical protein n=1 Tax=Agrobacterium vitis TaxID=373 RepID=UPI0008721576|nr:hypothetical protein [Agrobacterium vitis]MCE6074054.1 hypothetical protein [Agrobacterium vitis]MCF1454262.1 hypothetical protein [Agrobacterium vitis]MCM2450386.1 hypothetical protein [Agrobacterium vitis]MCM2468885.1 hypothetical protein [Agrobacterium vitis]MUO72316.1 hypothetical protein [Agrobacterium vitis]